MHAHPILASFVLCVAISAQSAQTVPAAFDAVDAPSRLWVAGFTVDLRQQTIIGASHLQALLNRDLVAVSFRRDAGTDAFTGGSTTLNVQIGTTVADPLSASSDFATNLGNPTPVFTGVVVVPNAPAAVGPGASWTTPGCTVRIPFATPFRYQGGSLVLDMTGTANSTQPILWWPADAAWDNAAGSVQSMGTGCGVRANANGEWASVAPATLLPGGTAQFSARGTENGLALLFLGAPAQMPGLPLSALLPGAPANCNVYLPMPATLLIMPFANVPFPGEGGTAIHFLRIPNQPWAMSASFGSQWMDLQQQFATSNAVNWTTAGAAPSLDMCLVRAVPGSASGIVIPNQAHVLRFEYQ